MGPNMAAKQQEMEVLENWEEIDETDVNELEKKFNTIVTPGNSVEMDSNGETTDSGPIKIILTGDDALRSQYVPPEPTVKILKRPSKDPQSTNNDSKVFQPKKTLKQREQEYAQARLRILGQTLDRPDENSSRISIVPKSPSDVHPSTSTSTDNNLIRSPKGPDGTKGFTILR